MNLLCLSRRMWPLVLVLCTAACDTALSPLSPSPSTETPAVSSLTLSNPSFVKTGEQVTFAATVVFENGARSAIEKIAWTSEAPAIATVNARGEVTGVAAGATAIVASFGGKSARAAFRVVPDYAGTWSGDVRLKTCTGQLDPRRCITIGSLLGIPRITVTLTMTDDRVTGTYGGSGVVAMPVTGAVAINGALTLEGFEPSKVEKDREAGFGTSSKWNVTVDSHDRMVGEVTDVQTSFEVFGQKQTLTLGWDLLEGLVRAPRP